MQGPGITAFFAKAPAGKKAPIGSPAADTVAAAKSEPDKQSAVKMESGVKPDLESDTGLRLHTNQESVKPKPDMKTDMKAPEPDKTAGADACDSSVDAGVKGGGKLRMQPSPAAAKSTASEQLQHQSSTGDERANLNSGPANSAKDGVQCPADPAAGPGKSASPAVCSPQSARGLPIVTGCVRPTHTCLTMCRFIAGVQHEACPNFADFEQLCTGLSRSKHRNAALPKHVK